MSLKLARRFLARNPGLIYADFTLSISITVSLPLKTIIKFFPFLVEILKGPSYGGVSKGFTALFWRNT